MNQGFLSIEAWSGIVRIQVKLTGITHPGESSRTYRPEALTLSPSLHLEERRLGRYGGKHGVLEISKPEFESCFSYLLAV